MCLSIYCLKEEFQTHKALQRVDLDSSDGSGYSYLLLFHRKCGISNILLATLPITFVEPLILIFPNKTMLKSLEMDFVKKKKLRMKN